MTDYQSQLAMLGLSDWFTKKLDQNKTVLHQLARVISVHKNGFTLTNGKCDVFTELSGNLLHSADSALDLPTVGDWVYADLYDEDIIDSAYGIIHGLVPRKSLLKRKTAGKSVDYQLIAANIDVAFIVQAADDNFNLRRLERYLVMVNDAGITPIILLSKSDLKSPSEISAMVENILQIAPSVSVVPFSNLEINSDPINF